MNCILQTFALHLWLMATTWLMSITLTRYSSEQDFPVYVRQLY